MAEEGQGQQRPRLGPLALRPGLPRDPQPDRQQDPRVLQLTETMVVLMVAAVVEVVLEGVPAAVAEEGGLPGLGGPPDLRGRGMRTGLPDHTVSTSRFMMMDGK